MLSLDVVWVCLWEIGTRDFTQGCCDNSGCCLQECCSVPMCDVTRIDSILATKSLDRDVA